MRGSRVGREARRRPELDLLVGPLEAATMEDERSPSDVSTIEDVELIDATDLPTWRVDG